MVLCTGLPGVNAHSPLGFKTSEQQPIHTTFQTVGERIARLIRRRGLVTREGDHRTYYAAINLVSAAISYKIGFIRDRVGLRRWFVAVPLLVGSLLAAMVFVPLVALAVAWASVQPTRVLAGQYVNDRIETLGRATVLSAMAMMSAVTVIPFQLGSGVLSDLVSLMVALSVAGVLLVVGSVAILVWESPIEPPSAESV